MCSRRPVFPLSIVRKRAGSGRSDNPITGARHAIGGGALRHSRYCWRIQGTGQSARISASLKPLALVAYSLEALLVRISGGLLEFASNIILLDFGPFSPTRRMMLPEMAAVGGRIGHMRPRSGSWSIRCRSFAAVVMRAWQRRNSTHPVREKGQSRVKCAGEPTSGDDRPPQRRRSSPRQSWAATRRPQGRDGRPRQRLTLLGGGLRALALARWGEDACPPQQLGQRTVQGAIEERRAW